MPTVASMLKRVFPAARDGATILARGPSATMRENAMTIIAGESTDACRLSLSLMFLLATVSTATAGSLGGPLELQDFGSFFVGGRPLESTHPGPGPTGPVAAGQIRIGQMYVQYLIPKTVSGPA